MGPLEFIGSFFMDRNVPTHAHWQFSSLDRMGPFILIIVLFIGKDGPICAHRPFLSLANNGPTQGHWQLSSWASMSPFMLIGHFFYSQ